MKNARSSLRGLRRLARALTLALALFLPWAAPRANPITTLGIYVMQDSPEYHPFWKACGYNTLELLDIGWVYRPDQLPAYYSRVTAEIARAHKDGFKVYVILLANMKQWNGPEEASPAGYMTLFNPADSTLMAERLDRLSQALTLLKSADGFILFPGDPGGNTEQFSTTIDQFLTMSRKVRDLVYAKCGPNTDFIINTWAAGYWVGSATSCFTRPLWDETLTASRAIVDAADLIGSLTGPGGRRVGIEFSSDNYYRPLALDCYAKQPNPPMELYPTAPAVAGLAARQTPHLWGWPYFMVDEADDGADGGSATTGQPQGEVRYIRKYVDTMRQLGLNGIMTNLTHPGRTAEVLDVYALARFCTPTTATTTLASVDDVFRDFAGLMATPPTRGLLEQVLKYLENKSTWHAAYPAAHQLPALDDGATATPWRALVRLRQVQPNPSPGFALPEPPAEYLRRVRGRLELLAASEPAPAVSHDHAGGEVFGFKGTNWAGDVNTEGGLDDALETADDRAAIVVSSAPAGTSFPSRFDQPLQLRRSHVPETIRLSVRKNAFQTAEGRVYWDDVLLGSVNAHAGAESMALVELPVPEALKQSWSAFVSGPHLLTLEVTVNPAQSRYFEIDALALADTPRTYAGGFIWDLLADYDPDAAAFADAGSVNLAANVGLSRAAPSGPIWSFEYSTAQPLDPAKTLFDPQKLARLGNASQPTPYGLAHLEPGKPKGATVGRVVGTGGELIGCPNFTLYARGLGSKPSPQVGTSVSPAFIVFQAPQDGAYGVDIALKGRPGGWHAAATLYQGRTALGPRQTCVGAAAMNFAVKPVSLKAGERLTMAIEGMIDDNWSEVLVKKYQISLVPTPRNAARGWRAY